MSKERERRNNVEFMRALIASGFSSAVCESINGIRKIIFENGDGVSRLLAIIEIDRCYWDKENGWSELEPINEPNGIWRDILDMRGKVFNDIADIRQTMKRVLGLDENDERCIEVTDHKHNDKEGAIEYSVYFDSYDVEDSKIVFPDDPNVCQAVSIAFYYKKTSKTYELTDETMEWEGHTLHRIRALKDMNIWAGENEPPGVDVKEGELGGWIESEKNLPEHERPSWVAGDAKVFGNAVVFDDSYIDGNAQVYDNAIIRDAFVGGEAKVYEYSRLKYGPHISEHANIHDHAELSGGDIYVSGNAEVSGNAKVSGYDIIITGTAKICGEGVVHEGETISEGTIDS